MTKGFDSSRMGAWKDSLEDWELCLCEYLAKDRLNEFNYELSDNKFTAGDIHKGLDALRKSPYLYKRFLTWFTSNQGGEGNPDDARDLGTWGSTEKNKELFIHTEDGKAYIKAMEEIKNKYQSD